MNNDSKTITDAWIRDYVELYEAFIQRPSEDLLRRAAAVGRLAFDSGVPPYEVANAHLRVVADHCEHGRMGQCGTLDAAQPLCVELMGAFGEACVEQRELNEYLMRSSRGAEDRPDRPESGGNERPGALRHVQRLLARSPAVIYSCGPGPDYPTTFTSENIVAFLGYRPEEFYAAPFFWTQRIHPEDADRVLRELSRVEHEAQVTYEYRFRHKDGRYIWLHDEIVPLKDAAGGVVGIVGSWFDITERRKSEAAQRETVEQLSATLDALPDLMFEVDVEGRFLRYRAPDPKLLYAPPEVSLGRTVSEALPPEAARIIMDAIGEAARTGRHRGSSFSLDVGRGASWFELSIAAKGEPASPTQRFIVLLRDITERKQAEQELRRASEELEQRVEQRTRKLESANRALTSEINERRQAEDELRKSEQRYRAIVEDQTEMICRWTAGQKHTFVNAAYCRALGKSADELLGRSFMGVIPEKDHAALLEHFNSLTPEHPVATIEHGVIAPDGELRWHQWTNRAVFDDDNQLIEYQSVGRDITEKRRAEDALRASEQRYRGLIESQRDLIVQFDAEGRFTFVNEACCRAFDKTREELLGGSFHPLVHPDDLRATLEAIEQLQSPPHRAQVEQRALTATGWRWLTWEYYPFRDEAGEIVEVQGVGWDVTERRLIERTARHRARILEAVGYAAERFLRQARWEASLDDVLERLGLATEVSRAYILRNDVSDSGAAVTSQIGKWVAEGIEPQADNSDLHDFDWSARGFERWRDLLGSGREVCGPVRGLPEPERVFLEAAGVRSILIVPVFVEDDWWGLIGFSDCFSEREWAKPEIDALRAAAGTLGAAIQRERTEEELRLFKTVSDDAMYASAIVDLDGNCVYVNEGCVRMHGWRREELIGRSLSILHAQDPPPSAEDLRERVLREGSFVGEEVWRKRRDGTVFPTLMSGTVIKDSKGAPKYIAVTAIDISERKAAEKALRASEERFRTVVDASKDAMIAIDPDELVVIFNPAAEKMFGRGVDEVLGRPLDWLMPPEYQEQHRRVVNRYFATGVSRGMIGRTLELPAVRKDGSVFPMELSLSAGRHGEQSFVLAVIRDTSLRKQAEEALRASEEKYRGIFDESVAAIYVLDADRKFVDSNQAGLELLGYTREELLGMSVRDVDADPERVVEAHQRLLAGQRIVNYEHELIRKDGRIITVLNNSRPLTDSDGNVVGMQSTLFDITERKRTAEELRRRRDEAANMTRLTTMGEMATGLAHEITQPLATILYYARGCQRRIDADRCDKAEMLRVTEKIALQAERGGAVVDRIRRFVRTGRPHVARVDLNAAVRQAVEFVDYELRDANVRVLLELPEELSPVSADMIHVEQVIINLLKNGREAMQDIGIDDRRLTVRTWNADGGQVACSVSDTGVGLAPNAAEFMFDAFFTTKPDGTGMGLSISRSIIESHRGGLHGRSNAGGGATFEFTLPAYIEERDDAG